MKLSGVFRIGFVAAIVTALILLPSCIAAGGGGETSTSASRQRPSTPQPRPKINIKSYIDSLKSESIHQLPMEPAVNYRRVPFYDHTPAYSIETHIETVRQALRDYGSVLIVDAPNRFANRLVLNDGKIKMKVMENGKRELINLFEHNLDPDLHFLRDLVRTKQIQSSGNTIDHLPFANGKFILFQGSENLGHMVTAAHTESKKFYYVTHGGVPILIDPNEDKLIVDQGSNVEGDLRRILVGYNTAKNDYGESVASMIWGNPIKPSTGNLRRAKISLKNSRLFSQDASREDMVSELLDKGIIRVQKNNHVYKVVVQNPEARPFEPFKFVVDKIASERKLLGFIPIRP
ncbi:hypothetical protein NDA18_005885 [Ustilago nuda]|nr:hypothetical protein NDA18_005885 [Ustilago nuda]